MQKKLKQYELEASLTDVEEKKVTLGTSRLLFQDSKRPGTSLVEQTQDDLELDAMFNKYKEDEKITLEKLIIIVKELNLDINGLQNY